MCDSHSLISHCWRKASAKDGEAADKVLTKKGRQIASSCSLLMKMRVCLFVLKLTRMCLISLMFQKDFLKREGMSEKMISTLLSH